MGNYYYCKKQVNIEDFIPVYDTYFKPDKLYFIIKDNNLDDYPYTHYGDSNIYHFNDKELNEFFINKDFVDRENMLNKLLENE